MHEMSIITSLLDVVREEMVKHSVQKLHVVRIRHGALTNVVPEALTFAFEALIQNTDLEGARLETELIPLTLHCAACNKDFQPPSRQIFTSVCPHCNDEAAHAIIGGKELYIKDIEAE